MPEVVVAIDPGRDKCGFAVVTLDGRELHKAVVPVGRLAEHIRRVEHSVRAYAVGDGTAAESVRAQLVAEDVAEDLIVLVDEYKSSEVGRRQYWSENPPRGWRRLLPTGMQVPPVAYDDHVAVELARRFLASCAADEKRVP